MARRLGYLLTLVDDGCCWVAWCVLICARYSMRLRYALQCTSRCSTKIPYRRRGNDRRNRSISSETVGADDWPSLTRRRDQGSWVADVILAMLHFGPDPFGNAAAISAGTWDPFGPCRYGANSTRSCGYGQAEDQSTNAAFHNAYSFRVSEKESVKQEAEHAQLTFRRINRLKRTG